jgi:hypothetical protein
MNWINRTLPMPDGVVVQTQGSGEPELSVTPAPALVFTPHHLDGGEDDVMQTKPVGRTRTDADLY